MSSIEQIRKRILEKKRLKELQAQTSTQSVSTLPNNPTTQIHHYNLRSHPIESRLPHVDRHVDLENKNQATEKVQSKPKQTDEMQLLLARIHKKKPTSASNLDVPTEGLVQVPMIDQQNHVTIQGPPVVQGAVSGRKYLQEQNKYKQPQINLPGMELPIQAQLKQAVNRQNDQVISDPVQEGTPNMEQQAFLDQNLDPITNSQQEHMTQEQQMVPDQTNEVLNREKSDFEQKMKNLEESGWQIPKLNPQQPLQRTGNTHSLRTLISGLQYLVQGIPVEDDGITTRTLSENIRILSSLVNFRS